MVNVRVVPNMDAWDVELDDVVVRISGAELAEAFTSDELGHLVWEEVAGILAQRKFDAAYAIQSNLRPKEG